QHQLEDEVKTLRKQLKEEEKAAQRLEEETKRKEEEKKRLDLIHKNKMRELKKKLLDSMMEQEIFSNRINEQIATAAKLDVHNQAAQRNISELRDQLEVELTDKEQIASTKKKLKEQLGKVKANLDDEKKVTKVAH